MGTPEQTLFEFFKEELSARGKVSNGKMNKGPRQQGPSFMLKQSTLAKSNRGHGERTAHRLVVEKLNLLFFFPESQAVNQREVVIWRWYCQPGFPAELFVPDQRIIISVSDMFFEQVVHVDGPVETESGLPEFIPGNHSQVVHHVTASNDQYSFFS